jgi:catechol 2,3-dioxygenase-like lactoylglutathione lyase family enzyme
MKNIDFEDAEQVGHGLQGFGVNLLVRDVKRTLEFLQTVFDFESLSDSNDYALLKFGGQIYQFHGDHTYSQNPLPTLLPENGPRGGGIELRLFGVDPDQAEKIAAQHSYEILMPSADKPHGLRECFILDPDGYCWVPSVKKK